MIRFIAAREVANDVDLSRPVNTPADAELLGTLTMLVLNRYLQQTDWESITEIYLAGLVDAEDMGLIKRAVRVLGSGGVEFV